jgi:hypothetical protein
MHTSAAVAPRMFLRMFHRRSVISEEQRMVDTN